MHFSKTELLCKFCFYLSLLASHEDNLVNSFSKLLQLDGWII